VNGVISFTLKPGAAKPAAPKPTPTPEEMPGVYQQMDVRLIGMPTGKAIPKGSMWTDFTHRFPFGDYDVTFVKSFITQERFQVLVQNCFDQFDQFYLVHHEHFDEQFRKWVEANKPASTSSMDVSPTPIAPPVAPT